MAKNMDLFPQVRITTFIPAIFTKTIFIAIGDEVVLGKISSHIYKL